MFINAIKQADIFYQLTPSHLDMLADICQEKTYQAGEFIFYEGTNGDELYIITQGIVDILVDPSLVGAEPGQITQPVTIATLRRGQSFGEIALVDQGVRSASARATESETHLLVIERNKIMLLCDTYPALGYRIMRNLAADLALKIRNSDLRIREALLFEQKSE